MRGCSQCGRPNCRQHRRARPARRAYSGTALERRVKAEAIDLYGLDCVYCGQAIDPDLARCDESLVMAHVVPHVDGGEYSVENVRPAHLLCNLEAGRRPIV